MEEAIILLVAQVSSSVTVLFGLIALILMIRAAYGLTSGNFKSSL